MYTFRDLSYCKHFAISSAFDHLNVEGDLRSTVAGTAARINALEYPNYLQPTYPVPREQQHDQDISPATYDGVTCSLDYSTPQSKYRDSVNPFHGVLPKV